MVLDVPHKALFDLYRNNALARPNRIYGGLCSRSHPLHEIFTSNGFPFTCGKDLYQVHLDQRDDLLTHFSFD
jgi:hypothetical protein